MFWNFTMCRLSNYHHIIDIFKIASSLLKFYFIPIFLYFLEYFNHSYLKFLSDKDLG